MQTAVKYTSMSAKRWRSKAGSKGTSHCWRVNGTSEAVNLSEFQFSSSLLLIFFPISECYGPNTIIHVPVRILCSLLPSMTLIMNNADALFYDVAFILVTITCCPVFRNHYCWVLTSYRRYDSTKELDCKSSNCSGRPTRIHRYDV